MKLAIVAQLFEGQADGTASLETNLVVGPVMVVGLGLLAAGAFRSRAAGYLVAGLVAAVIVVAVGWVEL